MLEPSLKAIAYNGRYVMMSYAPPEGVTMLKNALGWNMVAREIGAAAHAEILALVEAGDVEPVIGRTIGFEEIPAAIEDLANRDTVGRTLALHDR